jgi:aldoxime dehydratase
MTRISDDYVPPYPSFVARNKSGITRVVMAYFGVQYNSDRNKAEEALKDIIEGFAKPSGPGHWDRARWTDGADANNLLCTAYWTDPERFDAWFEAVGLDWTRVPHPGLGTFTEVLRPRVEHYETLFSAPDRPEGIATLAERMSDVVREHAYWGGARDRIPASQTDGLEPVGEPSITRKGRRVTVQGYDNICLIRSGQDWSDTEGEERIMYLRDVEPVLRAGMDFLRDHGRSIGCLGNRYSSVEDAAGHSMEKSYGMSWWKSLAALERWAESHPTHLAIFGAAMKYLSTLGPSARLKLYHEVTVAKADEQFFEYFNCHDRTGVLQLA